MPSSAILDVAIGIAFVYLFLSLICSVVNEGIATLLSLRAKNLVNGISSLFSESKIADGRQFVEAIYAHGLIRGLYKNPEKVDPQTAAKPPADIPAPAINLPLIEISLHLPSVLTLVDKWFDVNLPAYIPSPTFPARSSTSSRRLTPRGRGRWTTCASALPSFLPALPSKPSLSLIAETQSDVDEFGRKVQSWFNDSMDRAADRYKHRTQAVLLTIALAVTVVLNVDTIKLAQSLWNNPIERQAMVDLAQKIYRRQSEAAADRRRVQGTSRPDRFRGPATSLPLRMAEQAPRAILLLAGNLDWLVYHHAGPVAGPPFWFDTLNKFMQVRSAVRPKEKSQQDGDSSN